MLQRVCICGVPKSGNVWLWNIFRVYQQTNNQYQSYRERSGLSQVMVEAVNMSGIRDLLPTTGFDHTMDVFQFRDGALWLEPWGDYFTDVQLDPVLVLSNSSLYRTHSHPRDVLQALKKWAPDTTLVYVVRDPRPEPPTAGNRNCPHRPESSLKHAART